MKKQITKPDGTVEVVEGTAEELAEYERKIRSVGDVQEDGKKKGKKVLLSEGDVKKMIDEAMAKAPQNHYHFCGGHHNCRSWPSPIWVIPDVVPPLYIGDTFPYPYGTITCTSVEIKPEMGANADSLILRSENKVCS